jgi:hypothetical protein
MLSRWGAPLAFSGFFFAPDAGPTLCELLGAASACSPDDFHIQLNAHADGINSWLPESSREASVRQFRWVLRSS